MPSRAGVCAVSAGRDSICCIKHSLLSMCSHLPWPRHFLVLLPWESHERGGVFEWSVGGSFQQRDALSCTNKWTEAIFYSQDLPLPSFKQGPDPAPSHAAIRAACMQWAHCWSLITPWQFPSCSLMSTQPEDLALFLKSLSP